MKHCGSIAVRTFGFVLCWCCVVSLPWSALSYGNTAVHVEQFVEKIQQTYERTAALTADFVQVATLTSINRQQTSSGRLYVEKPHAIRWEYQHPDSQTILYDGTILRIYTPKRRQVLQTVIDEDKRANVALLFLAGVGKLHDAFTIASLPSQEAENVVLRLVPRSAQAGFTELHIAVNANSYLVEKILIYDTIGNQTEIRLTSLVVRDSLPAKTFELYLPPDTEVLTPADTVSPR